MRLVAMLLGLSASAWAQSRPTLNGSAPGVVILLQLGANERASGHEQRLYEELGLVLDTFSVLLQAPESKTFGRATLDEQLEEVLAVSERQGAVAVTWLSVSASNQVTLHLVARGTGRTLVRSIPAAKLDKSESALALAVRELLGTAFMFEPKEQRPAAVQTIVQQVQQQVAPPPPPLTEAPAPLPPVESLPTTPWRAHAAALTGIGLIGQQGASFVVGGQLGLQRWLTAHLAVGLSGDATSGPSVTRSSTKLTTEQYGGNLDALLATSLSDEVLVGVTASVGVGSEHFSSISLSQKDWWVTTAKLAAGAELRWSPWRNLGVFVKPAVSWSSHQVTVTATEDGSTALVTPRTALRVTAGVSWSFAAGR